jgi:D-sedoheptulose 7-phosphate isomerase
MNNVEKMVMESSNVRSFAKSYFEYLFKLLNQIDMDAIASFVKEMEKARRDKNTIFFIGNGGSASTASHMANDFGSDIRKNTGNNLPFRAMSLTDNIPVITAISNDDGYSNVFVNQLRIHYRSGDKLVAISASGNSGNILEAAKWVKGQGGVIMSLVGFNGGKLKDISDVVIHVKTETGEYGPVEDVHMIMDHLLANWLQYKILIKESKNKVS